MGPDDDCSQVFFCVLVDRVGPNNVLCLNFLVVQPTYVFMNSLRHHISRKGSILFQVPI